MTLPNFFVIGAGRSGTTSLQHYLSQHPEIFMPPGKAPSHFFCRDLDWIEDPYLRWVTRNYFVPDRHDYEALFDGVRGEKAIGETSPVYLADVRVAGGIAQTVPHAKLIAFIRHPLERIQARFVARTRDGLERRSLEEIIREELRIPLERECAFGTYVASAGCYGFLKTYFDSFPHEQIRVHLFEDFADSPENVLRDLFQFLDVDANFVPDTSTHHNKSGGGHQQSVVERDLDPNRPATGVDPALGAGRVQGCCLFQGQPQADTSEHEPRKPRDFAVTFSPRYRTASGVTGSRPLDVAAL